MKLEFDVIKDTINQEKHGLSLSDALLVFDAVTKITMSSARSSEKRQIDIALVEAYSVVLVLVYIVRNNSLRAISLRRASRAERRFYAKALGQAQ